MYNKDTKFSINETFLLLFDNAANLSVDEKNMFLQLYKNTADFCFKKQCYCKLSNISKPETLSGNSDIYSSLRNPVQNYTQNNLKQEDKPSMKIHEKISITHNEIKMKTMNMLHFNPDNTIEMVLTDSRLFRPKYSSCSMGNCALKW